MTDVVDGVIGPWFLQTFQRAAGAAGTGMHYVVLSAPLHVTLARAIARQGRGLTDETAIRTMHARFAQGCVVDAGSRDPQAVADDVLAACRAGTATVA